MSGFRLILHILGLLFTCALALFYTLGLAGHALAMAAGGDGAAIRGRRGACGETGTTTFSRRTSPAGDPVIGPRSSRRQVATIPAERRWCCAMAASPS